MKTTTIAIFTLTLAATISAACIGQDAKQPVPIAAPATPAQDPDKQDSQPVKLEHDGEAHPTNIWMQLKLKHSQKIFTGMVEGDLLTVEDSAANLKLVNRLERFVKVKSTDYRTQLKLFQYANEEILKGAKENNLDRVTLGYNQMTLSCVACHKQLRKQSPSP